MQLKTLTSESRWSAWSRFVLWLLVVAPLSAQQPATVIWDDPSPLEGKPETYTLTLEITVPATKDTPCTSCVSVPILLPAGTYTLRVVGTNAIGSSPPLTAWTVTTANLVPPASSLVDSTGSIWTRVAATSRIFRNGTWVASGSEILYLPVKKLIYYHAANGLWYSYHAPYWWNYGPTRPQ